MIKDQTYQKTVVTACDHNYVWGAILLGLSLRFFKVPCFFNVIGFNLTDADISVLESISDTRVVSIQTDDPRSVCTQKPIALLSADTDLITWMDADCVVTGDVDKYFIATEGKFQIRFRGKEETAGVYRNFYRSADKYGSIPEGVLKIWKEDINDLPEPRISSVCQTNCFTITKEHLPFIRLWQQQMEKVIPLDTVGVYSKSSVAYAMTDESVINSLFAFSSQAPATTEYLLDKDKNAYCAHFGLKPKPWQHWTVQSLQYYDFLIDLLIWAKLNKIDLPPIPNSMLPSNKSKEVLRAFTIDHYRQVRFSGSTFIRKILKKLR